MGVIDVTVGERSSFSAATVLFRPDVLNHSLFISCARPRGRWFAGFGIRRSEVSQRGLTSRASPVGSPGPLCARGQKPGGSGEPSSASCQYTGDFLYRSTGVSTGKDVDRLLEGRIALLEE